MNGSSEREAISRRYVDSETKVVSEIKDAKTLGRKDYKFVSGKGAISRHSEVRQNRKNPADYNSKQLQNNQNSFPEIDLASMLLGIFTSKSDVGIAMPTYVAKSVSLSDWLRPTSKKLAAWLPSCLVAKRVAFTLAEVLITLGIIGVVAALTLPTVIKNYQKHVTITRLQKAYSILGQVAQKSIADNGAIDLVAGEAVNATTVETFFATYWLPYFNGVKVFPDRQQPSLNNNLGQYKYRNGNLEIYSIGTIYYNGRIFFSTIDGTTYAVSIMYWKNTEAGQEAIYWYSQLVRVDINGVKPPNTYGKDVFQFEVDFEKGIARPYGFKGSRAGIDANCSKDGAGSTCAAKIMRDGWKISDDYPW